MPQEASPSPEYVHRPLDGAAWIRLVRVHPDLKDRRLSCSLEHFDPDSDTCPEYLALSYVWGNPTPRQPIYINRLVRFIHTNLWLLLRRAWLNGATAWFWVDALCLDQQSNPELNHQVPRVGDIFARACHVISWLGESERGVDALNAMTQLLARQDSGVFGRHVLDMRTPAAQRLDRAWTQLVRQEGSEYWQRVWVLQEVACAKASSVVYGPVAVDFELLLQCEELESLYQSWSTGTQDGPFSVAAEWIGKLYALRQLVKTGGRIAIVDLLEDLAGASSARLVDRLYGLIGLCSRLDPDFDPERLEVDYEKDLETVAWDFIILTMETTPPSSWKSFQHTITRVFRALGQFAQIAPPRNHVHFATTSQARMAQTRRICQIHDAVIASAYPWAGALRVESADGSVDSVLSATAALDKVLNHVCTKGVCPRQNMDKGMGVHAILALSLIVSNMEAFDGHQEPIDISEHLTQAECTEQTTMEPLPRLCEAHLPQHLRRSVHFRRSTHRGSSKTAARVHQLQPVTMACRNGAYSGDMTPRCASATPENPCDDSIVYLEVPELNLVLRSQRDAKQDKSDSWTREHVQWFCTACPLLWGALDEDDELGKSTEPVSPLHGQSRQMPMISETEASPMPPMPNWSPMMAPSVKLDSFPVLEESNRRFMSSADFPWGRRPSLMDAWKEHRARSMSRTSNGHLAE